MTRAQRTQLVARLLTLAALVLAVIALFLFLFGGGESYRVNMLLENSSQLVKGNEVKVGGVPDRHRDRDRADQGLPGAGRGRDQGRGVHPAAQGTRVRVLFDSLTSVAGRYLSLTPGPENGEEIPEDGVLPADQTRGAVDPDRCSTRSTTESSATCAG